MLINESAFIVKTNLESLPVVICSPSRLFRFSLPRRVVLFRIVLPLLLLIYGAETPLAAPAAAKERLIVAGSGTNLSATRLLARAFMRSHPEIDIEIPESIGSGAAIQAVYNGAIPIGMISRPLEGVEKNYGLTVLNYARTALVIGVHQSVPDEGITYDEFLDIYRGKKTHWKNGKEIIVLTRGPGESSIEELMKEITGFSEVYNDSQKAGRWSMLQRDQVMNQTLAKTPNAIGLSDLGTMTIEHLAIKPLKINGIAPSLPNIRNGRYRLTKTLSFVYRKERLPEPARLFIDFVQSEAAGKILNANGFATGN